MKPKYLIAVLRTMKIAGLYAFLKDWQSFLRMHFIYAALESGLLEALTIPSTREDLIPKLGVKRPQVLDAILDVGVSVRELGYKNRIYSIKGKRSRALLGKDGDTLSAMVQANITYYSAAYRNAADRMRGGAPGDDLKEMGSLVARFSKIAEPVIRELLTTLVTGKGPMRVLDVGCGSGIFMRTIHDANRYATGIGIDIDEEVVKQARENMQHWGLSERFKILAGDVASPPAGLKGPFDLITLFNVLYCFPSEERSDLLQELRSMLAPHGVLALAMHFKSNGRDPGAANLNMVNSSLKGLTPLPDLESVTGQLKNSGFHETRTERLMPGSTFYGIIASSRQ
jgi:2-polyprenyl-3-methyl-5-hydroxy-6-metoxy-1,4-benzoquinol methylase